MSGNNNRRGGAFDGIRLLKGVGGVRCPECNDWIWSKHRHDFRHCSCESCFVDGGRDYLRYGGIVQPTVEIMDVLINIETGEEKYLPAENGIT